MVVNHHQMSESPEDGKTHDLGISDDDKRQGKKRWYYDRCPDGSGKTREPFVAGI
jgi:hypothetical protein